MSILHSRLGKEGENIACVYLVDKGFHIIARNVLKSGVS